MNLATAACRTVTRSATRGFHSSPVVAASKRLSAAEWQSKVLESDKPVVVDFFAEYVDHRHPYELVL